MRVVDPAPAVARQVKRVLESRDLLASASQQSEMQFFTSGKALDLEEFLANLLDIHAEVKSIRLS